MSAVDILVDALQLFLTGGASNTDPAGSLGGHWSSARIRGLGVLVKNPIPAVRIDNAYPACGIGDGTLVVKPDGTLVFTPPGGGAGDPVSFPSSGNVMALGSDHQKGIRLHKEAGLSMTPGLNSTLTFVEAVEGVLSQGDVSNAQRTAGETTYRAIMLHVPGGIGVSGVKIWLPAVAGAQAVYSIGVETPASGGVLQTIANETTAPSGITWSTPTTEGTALTISTISPGEFVGLWIRRVFPAAGHANPLEKMKLAFKFTTQSTTFTEVYEQGFRIADTSLDRFELYVGVDASPDFLASSQPVATSPTLPFSWTPTLPSSGNATLHIVVRKRDKYGLLSFNVYEFLRTFVAHAPVLPPITPPHDVQVYDGAVGYIRTIGKYLSSDDPTPADAWELYVKFGSDPVPGVDIPVFTGAMSFIGPESGFARDAGPYTPGAIAHVILVAKRAVDSRRAAAAVVLKTLATIPDVPEGFMFGGSTAEDFAVDLF